MKDPADSAAKPENTPAEGSDQPAETVEKPVEEIGGPKGPDPTRFGDWSVKGRCIDF